jgi:chromosome partitioning protein
MKVLTVVSQKGGVGKTTLSLNLAFGFARRGHRVLLADVDPQGAIGLSLSRLQHTDGLAGFVGRQLPLDKCLLKTRLPELDLLPMGNIAVVDSQAFAARMEDGGELGRLVAEASVAHDLLVLDTPSGFGGATMGALRVGDGCVSPLQAEPLALRSARQLLEVIGALREEGAAIEFSGFALTMLDLRNDDSLGVAAEAWSGFPTEAILQTNIPRDPIFLKASSAGVPVGLLSRNPPPVAALFDQLAQELEPRLGFRKDEGDDEPISLFA